MKHLFTIIILTISTCSLTQVTDKVAHFGVGYISGAITSSITLIHSNGKNEWFKSLSIGTASGVLLGTAKELYDYRSYGKFDWYDLGFTVLGSALGSVTIKISINRYERKHLI